VYVATDRPPVCNRPYVAFDLTSRRVRNDLPAATGGARADDAAIAAFDAYRDAFEAHFNDSDVPAARAHVARARELQPRQSVYAFVAGLLELAGGDARAALRAFDDSLELGHGDAERVASFHLWRGRSLDALGRRDEARRAYDAAKPGDPNVRRAAEKNAKKPYKLRAPAVEWSFGDVISP
jgi:tetratricopeptide (TPR) repeat protein